jgi:hypothetical protein
MLREDAELLVALIRRFHHLVVLAGR